MKMSRCSSSLDTSFHLFDAKHCKFKASACAESVGPSQATSARTGS